MASQSQFEKIVSLDNLRKAWIKAYQYARTGEVFFDNYSYSTFAEHLEARLIHLSEELKSGSYLPSPLRIITIPKGEKERKIYFLSPKDAVVIQAVVNMIGADFESTFADESFGNRLSVDAREGKDIFQSWHEKYGQYVSAVRGFVKYGFRSWYLITDIKDYYPTISQDWLLGIIRARLDAQTVSLIELFVRNSAINANDETEPVPGLPPGPAYSHFFANIYLDEFDHFAKKLTLGYARYVDDICLVCSDREQLEMVKAELSKYLRRWGQSLKEVGKTVEKSIMDIEPLFEHTRKMKYAARLDPIEAHGDSSETGSMVSATEKPFFRLYKIAEREGNPDRIVDEAGFVISYLRTTGESDIADVIYSLLETHPVRPSTLKAILAFLMEVESPKPSSRFMDFFFGSTGRPAYVSTSFLELLVYFKWDVDLRQALMNRYGNDSDYLVRSSAFWSLSKMEPGLDSSSLELKLALEEADFVKERVIQCFARVESGFDQSKLIGYLTNPQLSVATLKVLTVLIEGNIVDGNFVDTLWGYLRKKQISLELSIYFFYLASVQGHYWILEEIMRGEYGARFALIGSSLSLDAINTLAQQSEIIKLHSFSNHAQEMGFLDTALVGYLEASERTGNAQLPDAISDIFKSAELGAGLPEWIENPETTRQIHRQSFGDEDYLSQYIAGRENHRGILEIVSARRILAGGFASYEEWAKFLKDLSRRKIIPKIQLGKFSDERFACFYEIPEGYSSISEIIANPIAKGALSSANVFMLGEQLLENIEGFQTQDFCFHSIDPLSIIWSPLTGEHFLAGIGSSLGTSRYHCGRIGCKAPIGDDEIGVPAAILHLGLLLFQLLSDSCPIERLRAVRSNYQPVSLPTLLETLDVLPHYKMILGRVLNSDLDKRYGSLAQLRADLARANHFRKELDSTVLADERKRRELVLIDFLMFRLQVITRNPGIRRDSPLLRSKSVLDELAKIVQYLSPSQRDLWEVGLERNPLYPEFPSKKLAKTASLEGRRLLDIAYGWEKMCDACSLRDKQLTALSRLFLYRSVAIEALASHTALIFSFSDQQHADLASRLANFCDSVDDEVENERELSIRIGPTEYGMLLSKEDLFELRRLPLWGKSDGNLYDYISSLRILGLFLVLIRCGISIQLTSGSTYHTKSMLKEDMVTRDVWILLRLLPALDDQITHLHDLMEDEPAMEDMRRNDVWLNFSELFNLAKQLNPGRRRAARLRSYQPRNYRYDADGLLDFGIFWKDSMPFDTKSIFLSGHPGTPTEGTERPVLFDSVWPSGRSRKITSVLAPIGRFSELPFKEKPSFVLGLSIILYQKKRTYENIRWVVLIIALFIFTWLAESIESIMGTGSPMLSALIGLSGALTLHFLTRSLEEFVKTRNLEDYDQIDTVRQKRAG